MSRESRDEGQARGAGPHLARIELDLGTPELAVAVERALAPEMGEPIQRSRASLGRDGSTLRLEIVAEDTGSLRSAVNSCLRLAGEAAEVAARAAGLSR